MHYTSRDVYMFISTQNSDPILERRTCRLSWQSFPIFQSDREFYKKISPSILEGVGGSDSLPFPTLCPEERQRRRLLFRNERKLYRRQCDATKQSIISIYSPDKDIPVYDKKVRRSDSRDALSYGRDIDFSKTFTEQFGALLQVVPSLSLYVTPDWEKNNCIYVNSAWFNKNCYLIFDSDRNEDCLYANITKDSKDCMELSMCSWCEHSYELSQCVNCFDCQYSIYCTDCSRCYGCRSCIWCTDCINCFGLSNKQYCINNKQYTKEEYEQLAHTQTITQPVNATIYPATHISQWTTSNVIGNNVMYAKDILCSYDIVGAEKISYSEWIAQWASHLYDHSSFGENAHRCIECEWSGRDINNVLFSWNVFINSSHIMYSRTCCENSSHLFGCVWLRNKQYCIFNKQYTKHEYEQLVPQLIAHMKDTGERGEFLDPSLSPFGYNETLAHEHFPLSKQEALKRWYWWQDENYDPQLPASADVHDWSSESTFELDDQSILSTIFLCEKTQRPYRLVKQELIFYRKHNLPLPRRHPDQRHADRQLLRPPRELHLRQCNKTWNDIISVYSASSDKVVYSHEAYQQELFS